jgi:predicted SnoaL-like aldol condensation-catalyzing enzyme
MSSLRRGLLAAAALMLAACASTPSGSPPASSAPGPAPTTVPAAAPARELVGRDLDTTVGAGRYELLVVLADGSSVVAVHRAPDAGGAGVSEVLTTYRLDGGRLGGATRYRTTQKPGAGPTTPTFASTGSAGAEAVAANRQLVVKMYHDVIDLRQPDAPARYMAEGYIQHNPMVPQGRAGIEGFIQRMGPAPEGAGNRRDELVVADGDFVLLVSSFGTGRIADLFRVEAGMVAEHWDFTPAT